MAEKYATHNVYLESADFYVLIIEFPEEDINDKLAVLASEKGLIYRPFYEDFIIGHCMANTGPFFYHVRRRPELLTKFSDIRREALELVYKYSPGFRPENLVINQNNVIKTKSSVRKDEKVRPLVSNELWDQEPPLSSFGPAFVTGAPAKDKDDNPFLEEEPGTPSADNPFTSGGDEDVGVPYELVGHRWDAVGISVNVRKYEDSEPTLIALLGGTPFESARGYHLLIVQRCIEDFADVFQVLDEIGISKKIAPATIVEDLYNIAISFNPFLKLEEVDLKTIRKKYKEQQREKMRNNKRTAAAGSEDRVVSTGHTKRFADVPKEKLLKLQELLQEKVVGQKEALAVVAEAIQRAAVGLKREHEPVGVFLFTGSTGVGKTETAKALAECLDAKLVRIDCQEYQQPHEPAKLVGSPPGYIGYEDGGHLTKEVGANPFSVILFDEIEKAHSNFHERVLQIIDDGVLTDNKGKKISFSQTIIIMTSNIGVKEVEDIGRAVGFGDSFQETDEKSGKAREEALKRKFKPEFLNRIDEVVNFRRLEKNDYLSILDILLKEVNGQIKSSKAITLTTTAAAKDFLLDKGIDKKFGARPLRRAIKRYLNTPLAQLLLADTLESNTKINVSVSPDKESLTFKAAAKSKKSKDT